MDFRSLTGDELRVFEVLQKGGPRTKKYLEAQLGWTPSTTNRVIQSLLRKGAILETGLEESTGGRRPSVFDIQARGGYLLGVHISYGFIRVVLCDLKLRVLEQEMLLLPPARDDPETVLEAVAGTFSAFLARQGISRQEVMGAGLGMFGPLDREKGVTGLLMDYDQPIRPWSGLPIRDLLQEKLGVPVWVDSSCNVGALAEFCCGEGRDSRNTAFFLCDIGFSVGQIGSGRILRRWDGRDDGFSHVSIDMNGELCHCGKRGCVHLYASVRAINKRIRQRVMSGAPTLIPVPPEQSNFGHILQAAARGDGMVTAALAEAGSYFGSALSNYLNLISPDHVVIGGPMAEDDTFYNSVLDTLVRYHGDELIRSIRFRQNGSFGGLTVAVGAAALCYGSLMNDPILA